MHYQLLIESVVDISMTSKTCISLDFRMYHVIIILDSRTRRLTVDYFYSYLYSFFPSTYTANFTTISITTSQMPSFLNFSDSLLTQLGSKLGNRIIQWADFFEYFKFCQFHLRLVSEKSIHSKESVRNM